MISTTFLTSSQNADGGWGYASGQASTVEATAVAALALQDRDTTGAFENAMAWLCNAQHQDGGWGFNATDEQSGWHSAWAVFVLAKQDPGSDVVSRGVEWLLSAKPLQAAQDEIQGLEPALAVDLHLRGWPWFPGEACWVEPTALSMLALAATQTSATARVLEAARYLLDRRCQGGGWNVGSPIMFSQSLPPRAHPTSWALLALAQIAPNSIETNDVSALRGEMVRDGGVSALAWGVLALRSLGLTDEAAIQRLRTIELRDGIWRRGPYETALTLLALGLGFPL